MALVKFVPPYNKIAGIDEVGIESSSLGELMLKICSMYGEGMNMLFDEQGRISPKAVIMVNRRSARSLNDVDTQLEENSEVIIMEYLGWA